MIQQYLGISPDKLIKAGWETLYMVGFSLIIGSIVGFFIAIVLWLTRKGGLKENPLLDTILNGFINIIRSTDVYKRQVSSLSLRIGIFMFRDAERIQFPDESQTYIRFLFFI